MSQAGDQSNLILDPDLDSYYLMELVVNRLPLLTEQIGQARAFSSGLAGRDAISDFDQFRLQNLASVIESQRETLNHHFDVSLRETHDTSLSAKLEPLVKRGIATTGRFLELIETIDAGHERCSL